MTSIVPFAKRRMLPATETAERVGYESPLDMGDPVRLLLLVGLLALCGCGARLPLDASQTRAESASKPPIDAELGEAFTLRIGQEARIASESLTLLFRSVPDDSRCPEEEGVACVWAGNAVVRIEVVTASHTRQSIDLNTTLEPQRGSYLTYEVRLLSLAPAARSDTRIAPESYVAQLMVIEPSNGSGAG